MTLGKPLLNNAQTHQSFSNLPSRTEATEGQSASALLPHEDREFGTGELIPFQPNNIQRILHARCEDQLKKTGRVRQIVLKPRRSGLSTYCLALFFRYSVFSENARIAVIAHDQPTSSTLFNMVRLFMLHYPKPISPKVGYQGK